VRFKGQRITSPTWSAKQNSFDFLPRASARISRFRLSTFSRWIRAIPSSCLRSLLALDFMVKIGFVRTSLGLFTFSRSGTSQTSKLGGTPTWVKSNGANTRSPIARARQNSVDGCPRASARMTRRRLAKISRWRRAIPPCRLRIFFAFAFISDPNICLLDLSLKRYFHWAVLVYLKPLVLISQALAPPAVAVLVSPEVSAFLFFPLPRRHLT